MSINEVIRYICYLLIGVVLGLAGLGLDSWQFWVICILVITAVSSAQLE